MSVKVKVCGVTRTEDAIAVIDAGADALGLNFVESSPRYVDLEVAKELSDVSAGLIARVGVFLDASQQQIEDTIKRVDLDFLQFHGSEEASECEKWGIPYVKALRVTKTMDWTLLSEDYQRACCLLLDTFKPGIEGGTGEVFDWNLWPNLANIKLVLAGGLESSNVKNAIRATNPYGVDVSTGVETSAKGIKSSRRIEEFVKAAKFEV